jgi:hypothetical protein
MQDSKQSFRTRSTKQNRTSDLPRICLFPCSTLASQSSRGRKLKHPFRLIAIVNAAAKTLDKEHDADAEYITKATDNAEDFILWAWGVGASRVTKTSFSIDPNNTDLEPFKTQRYQACILTVGAAWTVPNGLPPLLQGDQTNLAVLGLLNTTISQQSDQQEEQNNILEKQVNHMINKENSSKNCVKNLHKATIKMILFTSAMDNEVPDDVTDFCKHFMNSKSVALAEQELNQQFETTVEHAAKGLQMSKNRKQSTVNGRLAWAAALCTVPTSSIFYLFFWRTLSLMPYDVPDLTFDFYGVRTFFPNNTRRSHKIGQQEPLALPLLQSDQAAATASSATTRRRLG